jgi:hypothetical protein
VGQIDVFVNGVRMAPVDITATNGTSVVFGSALANSDVVDIVAYTAFDVVTNNADDLSSGTVPDARITGAYTGITNLTATGVGSFGTLAVSGATTITTADNTTQLTLTSTDADNNIGPQIDLRRDSASPADGDVLGRVRWLMDDDAGNLVESAILQSNIEDASQGAVDAQIQLTTSVASTMRNRMMFKSTEAVFNEDGVDLDFRVESDTITHALFVDGTSGKVGIGIGNPASYDDGGDRLVIGDTSARSGMTIVSSTSTAGSVHFADGTGTSSYRGILAYYHDDDSMRFSTAGAERLRIDSAGYVYIATNGAEPSASQVGVSIKGVQGQNFWKSANSGTTGYDHLKFFNGNGAVGSIFTNGSGTTYSTSSDYRLKENVTYDFDATSRLKQLKPSRFNFIADADTTVDGFLAHEVSSIVPEAIGGTKDATEDITDVVLNADGTVNSDGVSQSDWTAGKSEGTYANDTTWVASKTVPKYQGIDQSKLVPLLTKALQEQQATIEALTARIITLENV